VCFSNLAGLENKQSVQDIAEGVRQEEADRIAQARIPGARGLSQDGGGQSQQPDDGIILRQARQQKPAAQEKGDDMQGGRHAADDPVFDELYQRVRVVAEALPDELFQQSGPRGLGMKFFFEQAGLARQGGAGGRRQAIRHADKQHRDIVLAAGLQCLVDQQPGLLLQRPSAFTGQQGRKLRIGHHL